MYVREKYGVCMDSYIGNVLSTENGGRGTEARVMGKTILPARMVEIPDRLRIPSILVYLGGIESDRRELD